MTGLDKILDQIRQESEKAIAEKIGEAESRAKEIQTRAEAEVKEECAAIELQGERSAEDTLSRAESAAALYRRKAVLAEKQRIIAEVFDRAEEKLKTLPADEYFEMIIKIAAKNALPQKGEIIFSEADQKRLPVDFEMRLNILLKKQSDCTLSVSKETRPMDGGFVLSYGGIEQNCTIRALIDMERELAADRVQSVLFS